MKVIKSLKLSGIIGFFCLTSSMALATNFIIGEAGTFNIVSPSAALIDTHVVASACSTCVVGQNYFVDQSGKMNTVSSSGSLVATTVAAPLNIDPGANFLIDKDSNEIYAIDSTGRFIDTKSKVDSDYQIAGNFIVSSVGEVFAVTAKGQYVDTQKNLGSDKSKYILAGNFIFILNPDDDSQAQVLAIADTGVVVESAHVASNVTLGGTYFVDNITGLITTVTPSGRLVQVGGKAGTVFLGYNFTIRTGQFWVGGINSSGSYQPIGKKNAQGEFQHQVAYDGNYLGVDYFDKSLLTPFNPKAP